MRWQPNRGIGKHRLLWRDMNEGISEKSPQGVMNDVFREKQEKRKNGI